MLSHFFPQGSATIRILNALRKKPLGGSDSLNRVGVGRVTHGTGPTGDTSLRKTIEIELS